MQTNDELVLREVNPTLKNIKLFDKKTEDDSASQTKSEVLLQDENSATTIVKSLSKEFEVYAVDKPTYRSRHQPAPLKTSSMQITAINKLG
jgi:DNA topoisomerase IA